MKPKEYFKSCKNKSIASVWCRGGSRYVDGCWGIPDLKMKKFVFISLICTSLPFVCLISIIIFHFIVILSSYVHSSIFKTCWSPSMPYWFPRCPCLDSSDTTSPLGASTPSHTTTTSAEAAPLPVCVKPPMSLSLLLLLLMISPVNCLCTTSGSAAFASSVCGASAVASWAKPN